ncbi:glycoside hydrolase superfamily [Mycena galopus ATCC 62051]|nr:glycoside hydrolase superfamily [Mycena galopus ATCC 62051]
MAPLPDVSLSYGPMLIGVFINLILYGVRPAPFPFPVFLGQALMHYQRYRSTWSNVGADAPGAIVAEPFLEGVCWKYIVRMLGWTQHPRQPRSSHCAGIAEWQARRLNGVMGIANAQHMLDYIRIITEINSEPEWSDVVPIFGIINAAILTRIGRPQLSSLFIPSPSIRNHLKGAGNGPFLSIHDGFDGVSSWAGFLAGSDRIMLDTHPYFAFDQQPNDAPIATGTGLQAGHTRMGRDCDLWEDASTWTVTVTAGVALYALASMDALRDWFFWTRKIGNATDSVVHSPLWSYQLGLRGGWIPTGPRTALGMCAALNDSGAPFDGTFSTWQTGGGDAGIIAAAATAQFGVWPPLTISDANGAATLLPT